MKKLLIITILIMDIYGANLRDIIANTQKENGYIRAKEFEYIANQKEINSIKNSYLPSVDIAINFDKNSPKNLMQPGSSTSLSVLLNYKIYDSGKRKNEIKANRVLNSAKDFEIKALRRSLAIKAINIYYEYFKAKAKKDALIAQKRALISQIDRVKRLLEANLVTKVELDRLNSALSQNQYALSSIDLAIKSAKENLKVLSHLKLNRIKYNRFINKDIKIKPNEEIERLKLKALALNFNKKSIDALLKPQIDLKYRYSKIKNSDIASNTLFKLPGHNSKLSLSASMRLYDGGVIKEKREALSYKKLALLTKADELFREQKRDFKLAKLKLKTLKSRLYSAKMALKASKSAYLSIKKQYIAGFVDYTTFISALVEWTVSKAQYKEALIDTQLAKAYVYYYSGRDLKGFIR